LISMRYGDKDGFNEIYDGNGELVLHNNEKTLVVEENVVPTFKSTWRYYGGDYLLEPSKGTIYLTTERLVFINIPERMFAIGEDESRAVGSAMEKNFELGDMSPGAATREFFEIPNIEIMASERKEGAVSVGEMVNVYVLSSGNQFHLSMVLTSDSDLLKRLMNKRVQNLDELVNNLKDYFQKTEWMFTDAEKKIYGGSTQDKIPSLPSTPSRSDQIPQIPKAPRQKAPEPSSTYNPTIPRSRVSDGVGKGSVRYFQNLFRKGLIKEEIYRRLMGQYGIDPDSAISDDPGPPIQQKVSPGSLVKEEPPEPVVEKVVEPASMEPEAPPVEDDEELLSMLNDTLSDFSDDPEEAEPVIDPEQPSE
jgi:hypothetical protein